MSIGLAVFNGEEFVREAIDSLLSQTYRDFDLIISDNASVDRTEQICREYAAKDERIRYHRNASNLGAVWNINKVLQLSSGEYFKWAAHDDVCAPLFLERCVDVLDSRPSAVLCYTDTVIIDEHGHQVRNYEDRCEATSPLAHERFRTVLNNFGLSNPLYGIVRTEVLRSVGGLGTYLGSDAVLLAELALRGEIVKVPELLFLRRDHPHKASRANPTHEDLASWYAPENKNKVQVLNSRLFKGYLVSLWRARLPWSEKLPCYAHVAKWFRWKRHSIASELRHYAKRSLRNVGSRAIRGASTNQTR